MAVYTQEFDDKNRKSKNVWKDLKKNDTLGKRQFRDVYETQDFERSQLSKKISPTPRKVFAIVIGVFVFLALYVGIGIIVGFFKWISNPMF